MPGSTDIYVCKDDNVLDLTQQVGTYAFIAGSVGAVSGTGNDLYLATEQFEINGCILQRTGTWKNDEDAPTKYGIWTTTGNSKGCPKPFNSAEYQCASVKGTGDGLEFEMYTLEFKRPVTRTPLTTTTHSSKE